MDLDKHLVMVQAAGTEVDRCESSSSPTATRRTDGSPETERAAALRDALSNRKGERHVVAIQDFPDPDAISSALAYKLIAHAFAIEADILYDGVISHPENLALVNLLEVELIRYTEAIQLKEYDAAVYIDNQGTTTRLFGRLHDAGVPTFAVVDHHDPQDRLDPIFSDIRPVGAAATQFAEYLASGLFFTMDAANEEHVELATALLHGLHSETGGFVRAGQPEFAAGAFLIAYANQELLERVLCVQKSHGTMQTIMTALERRSIGGGLALAGVGYIRSADRDSIPQAADFLLKEENVKTAIVFGIIDGEGGRESLVGSLRTTDPTLAVDQFLKDALGKDPAGRYYGGGRSRAGGFEIDLAFLAGANFNAEEREAKWALFDRQIRQKLSGARGLDRSKGD